MTGIDPTLRVKVDIDGVEQVESELKDVERAGTEAAKNINDEWRETSARMEEFAGKLGNVGTFMTQNLTLPIAALGAAAVAMTHDILGSEEAIAQLSDSGQRNAAALQAEIDELTASANELKMEGVILFILIS